MNDFLKYTNLFYPAKQGIAQVDKFAIESGDIKAMKDNIPPGEYVRLLINNKTIMSNTPMEYEINLPYAEECFGDVLIGGLGLGLILLLIQNKPEVTSITVVEKYRDVIDIIRPQLPLNSKVRIICNDVTTFEAHKKYDYIYLDIWYNSSPAIFKTEMLPLVEKYKAFLKPVVENHKRKVACWIPKEFDELFHNIGLF